MTDEILLERDLSHPPHKVWRALTQPHLLAEWLMPNDFAATEGHRSTFAFPWGQVACEVTQAEPPETLTCRWQATGLDTTLTFTLTPTAQGTRLRLHQTGFTEAMRPAWHGARTHWPGYLSTLETLLTREP